MFASVVTDAHFNRVLVTLTWRRQVSLTDLRMGVFGQSRRSAQDQKFSLAFHC